MPYILVISSSNERGYNFLKLSLAAKKTISPSYVWPLRYIYNRTIPVVPPLMVHGSVEREEAALHFDGITAWLDAGELSGM